VSELFVPEHRLVNAILVAEGNTAPDCGNDAPVFHTPRRSTAGFALAAIGVGAAQGMLDAFVRASRSRVSRGIKLAEEQWLQIQIAEAAASLRAAELLLVTDARETMALFANGGKADIASRALDKRDASYVALLARQVADKLYGVSGGYSLHTSNPLQRYFRDIHAATAHFGLRWEHSAVPWARLTLGLEPGPGYY
jgi:3-hydroxy-9,10-secoandrosta-1,3,5(10)-triene-9,17-dione monooxygenase